VRGFFFSAGNGGASIRQGAPPLARTNYSFEKRQKELAKKKKKEEKLKRKQEKNEPEAGPDSAPAES
jgi:hypothetical protein